MFLFMSTLYMVNLGWRFARPPGGREEHPVVNCRNAFLSSLFISTNTFINLNNTNKKDDIFEQNGQYKQYEQYEQIKIWCCWSKPPRFPRLNKVGVSSTNIFRSGLTQFSSWDLFLSWKFKKIKRWTIFYFTWIKQLTPDLPEWAEFGFLYLKSNVFWSIIRQS